MRINAVVKARLLAFVEIASLNPKGRVFFPNIVAPIVERFNFQVFPSKPGDFDETKGVSFSSGNFDGINVPQLTIFNNGFLIDTEADTSESERILMATLEWAKKEIGITFSPEMIYRRRYLSDLLFHTDTPILHAFTPMENLRNNLMDMTQTVLGERMEYSPTRFDMDFERHQRQAPIAPLTIQRRTDFAFSDNQYYSEAPLPTELHWELLVRFEKDVRATMPSEVQSERKRALRLND